jgi:hypothetical protein
VRAPSRGNDALILEECADHLEDLEVRLVGIIEPRRVDDADLRPTFVKMGVLLDDSRR